MDVTVNSLRAPPSVIIALIQALDSSVGEPAITASFTPRSKDCVLHVQYFQE
jgi:hypothetical protein